MSDMKYTYSEDYWDAELPVNGSHDICFSNIGFTFGSFKQGDILRDAKLPEGWIATNPNNGRHYICDTSGACRVVCQISSAFAQMYPLHRFTVEKIEVSNIEIEFVVWDRQHIFKIENPSKIFSKKYSIPDKGQHPEIYKLRSQQYAEEQVCQKWLNRNLPGWEGYDAYWGDVLDFSKME